MADSPVVAIHFAVITAALGITALFASDPYWFVVGTVIFGILTVINFAADSEIRDWFRR